MLRTGHPITVVGTWSPDDFELFVHEWVFSCVSPRYGKVVWAAGAGDKGRDVRAFVADEHGDWDSYQCKRYKEKLAPSDVWLEFGKLCYYSFLGPLNGGYRAPRAYYLVAQHGVGPSLLDLIQTPDLIRIGLKEHWADKCRTSITSAPIEMDGGFLDFLNSFDFSIVSHRTPREMVEDIEMTRFYPWFFGLRKLDRPELEPIPDFPTGQETGYVTALYNAYAEHLQQPLGKFDAATFDSHEQIRLHFRESRQCFYYAEQLLRLGRDTYPRRVDVELLDQIYYGIISTVRRPHQDGYARVVAVTDKAGELQIGGNCLGQELRIQDRSGLCHCLANDGRVIWVTKEQAPPSDV